MRAARHLMNRHVCGLAQGIEKAASFLVHRLSLARSP